MHDRIGAARQRGLALAELMISCAIGLVVALAASALLLSVQRSYSMQDDILRVDENGRYALELLTRAVRQAGFVEGARGQGAPIVVPAVLGLDSSTLPRDARAISGPQASDVNGSDVLALRYAGSADGALRNCAGFSADGDAAAEQVEWSIFYLARDAAGEPQLYCKYAGERGWSADAVVAGVEGFQVLYGIDTDDDGLADRMLNAGAIGPAEEAASGNLWARVVMVRVALLLRGPSQEGADGETIVHDLFGPEYSARRATADPGVQLREDLLVAEAGPRVRRVVEATAYLRNPAAGAAR